MNEASKAMRRRLIEDELGIFNWSEIFTGNGIDVGCGPDKIWYDSCRAFDLEHGDANVISNSCTCPSALVTLSFAIALISFLRCCDCYCTRDVPSNRLHS